MLKGLKNKKSENPKKGKIEIQQGPLTDECIVFALNRITKQKTKTTYNFLLPLLSFCFYYYLIHITSYIHRKI